MCNSYIHVCNTRIFFVRIRRFFMTSDMTGILYLFYSNFCTKKYYQNKYNYNVIIYYIYYMTRFVTKECFRPDVEIFPDLGNSILISSCRNLNKLNIKYQLYPKSRKIYAFGAWAKILLCCNPGFIFI